MKEGALVLADCLGFKGITSTIVNPLSFRWKSELLEISETAAVLP